MDLSLIVDTLNTSGQTILGVIIGGGAVILAQRFSANSMKNAARETNDTNIAIAAEAGKAQMKATVFAAALEAYEKFYSLMTEWEISVRDERELGHDKVSARDEYAGWILTQDWESATLLGRLAALTSDPFHQQAEYVRQAGLSALRSHAQNYYTGSDDQDQKHRVEQDGITALETFREKLADLPLKFRDNFETQ